MSLTASLSVNLEIPGLPEDSGPLFELLVFPMPRAQFWVHELTGHEELSELYHFDVTVSTESMLDGIVERALIGQRATLIIRARNVPRVVRGVVSAITVVRRHPHHGRTQYRIRIVPRLWLLSLKRRSRIFQHLSVAQIVTQVLTEAGIASHWLLERDYPARVYCTQYEESDYAFITRILAEAGIYFHVANPPKMALSALAALSSLGPPPGGPLGPALSVAATITVDAVFGAETIIFSDGALGYSPLDDGSWLSELANMVGVPTGFTTDIGIGDLRVGLPAPKLQYLAMEGSSGSKGDKVTAFEATREVLTTSASYRDYDPRRPNALLVSAEGHAGLKDTLLGAVDADVSIGTGGIDADASVDVGGTLIAAALQALSGLPDLEHYDHHAPFLFPSWKHDAKEADTILRQKRRRRHHAEGRSFVSVMHVGHRFGLEDHPLDHLNIDYAVIAVRHIGRNTTNDSEAIYENEFECVVDRIPYCPDRPDRENVNSVLTARVVGPTAQEIYTDDLGQIKVQFHWDREGGRNEHSSCWLRTMQTWAGTGWGTQFTPRVGMEVIVAFEGGDPDKPICLGCINNATHLPSFATPEQKTRSGFRTQSTPNAAGFNELSFEDKANHEQIYLHAQRDHDEVVRRNHTLKVGADETLLVTGVRRDTVGGDCVSFVGGSHSLSVDGSQEFALTGSRIDIVRGNADYRTNGARTLRVEGTERRDIASSSVHHYRSERLERVEGTHTIIVGKHDKPQSFTVRAEGVASISASLGVEIESEAGITFKCGASAIRIGKDGIEVTGEMVRMAGQKGGVETSADGVKLTSDGVYAHLGDKLLMKTEQSSVAMGAEVKVDAPKIHLNSPDRAIEEPPPEPEPLTEIEIVDQDGVPVPNQRFIIEFEDGSCRSGATDKEGKAKLEAKSAGVIRFPGLSNVSLA